MIRVILQLQYYRSMDSSDLASSDFYVPEMLYKDPQVTLYADFRMDIRENQDEPDSRPTYIQEILSGKRRLVSMGWLRFPSLSATTLTPVQRLSTRRKSTSTNRVIVHRRNLRQKTEALIEQLRSKMIAEVPTRLQTLESDFSELEKGESEWPPSALLWPSSDVNFYLCQ